MVIAITFKDEATMTDWDIWTLSTGKEQGSDSVMQKSLEVFNSVLGKLE